MAVLMNCRACNTPLTRTLVDLGDQPLANALLQRPDDPDPRYPLHVYICDNCLLVQAAHAIPPTRIFHDYPFRSAASPPWLEHCRQYVKTVTERFSPRSVLEVGSNDGTLLDMFDIPKTGVDPACTAPNTIRQFFTAELADDLHPADLVVANNVIGHVPDIDDFIAGLATVTRNVLTIEIPWVYHLLHRVEYDCIYHEHFSYWSAHALLGVLARHGLHVFDIEHLPDLHGGSLRYYIGDHPLCPSVAAVLQQEADAGITNPNGAIYTTFADRVHVTAQRLHGFLAQHDTAGIGAPAKANTLLNTAGVTADMLAYTTDTTPAKQGKFLPGSHVPIRHPAYRNHCHAPDFLLVLAWNWWDEIIDRPRNVSYVHPLTLEIA